MSSNPAPSPASGVSHSNQPSHGHPHSNRPARDGSPAEDISAEELLELLGDEYTREVLEAVVEYSRSGREVAETTSVSKPTAFRRLNALEAAGLVTTEMVIEDDGHHHKAYRSVLQSLSFELGPDGIDVEVDVESQHATAVHASLSADD